MNGCRRVSWISDVFGPEQAIPQDAIFARRYCPRIIGELIQQIRDSLRKAGKITELAGLEDLTEIANQIYQELLGALFIFCKIPDNVTLRYVRRGKRGGMSAQWRAKDDAS